MCLLLATALVTGLVEPAAAQPTDAVVDANQTALTDPAPGAYSADVAVDGFGDAQGYHLQVSRGGDGFTWQELAVLRPADMDVESWTGYQCLSGDGRFAAVTILPTSQVNEAEARDHGAFAYSVDLGSGEVHPIAAGVGLKYYSPGCGITDAAVLTTMLGTDQSSTVLSTADLSTGAVTGSVTVAGQVTSTVPTATGRVGVMGSALVSVGDDGASTVLATVKGDAYDLRPASDGGVNFLSTEPGADTATVHHEINGTITDLGTGPRTRVQLFAGRDGGAVLSGYVQVDDDAAAAAQLAVVPDGGLAQGAAAASLDGGLLIGPDANGDSGTPVQLDPSTKQVQPVPRDTTPTAATPDATVAGDAATGTAGEDQSSTATQDPAGPAAQQDAPAAGSGPAPVTEVPSFTPPGVDTGAAAEPDPVQGLKPAGDVAPAGLRSTHRAITNAPAALTTASDYTIGAAPAGGVVTAPQVETAPLPLSSKMATGPPSSPAIIQAVRPLTQQAALLTPQTPTCAVPRNDLNTQVMQPSPAQADWAVQMAEQGLLTGATYTRPAGYANMGFPAYAPSTDFPPTALSHPSGSSTTTVPRIVFEAIMAQESNFSQASWHSPAGNSGNPLIADYYGAGGDIVSINYAGADCGYGISQVTTGMHVGDHTFSARGQVKVAVDYQENIAAGLQILEDKWNQLYAAGIIANNGDPKYLENWYFAAWAYNGGVQPSSAYNSTGCTPGPTCTGPHGTWGLGWTNNPDNLDYPPNRSPYLQASYADAAHPASWPYQERVMGWMASPIQRYGAKAYAKPTYNGGKTWLQIPAFNSFCSLAGNNCDPVNTNTSNPGATHCMFDDFQCWWHTPVTWIPDCATTCATSPYLVGAGSTEPAFATPNVPTCTIDQSKVPAGSIIVDDETSPPVNIQGCNSPNWTTGGTFTYTPGTNAAGDPIGAIDTHQLGVGLGGHVYFTHTEDGTNPDLINTGTWTPTLPSLQYYTVKIHVPSIGATTTDVVYTINPGGGVSPWKIRVNQNFGSEQWATIGTFAMQNGGNVVLTNQSTVVNSSGTKYYNFDVAYDAIAFVPQGGTPGTPIGGPPTVQDEPNGSNPAWLQCGCAQRTAGDPVNTATGYFGDHFTDLSTPGRGMPLSFTRTYNGSIADPTGPNSALAADGPFGYGWTYSYNMSAVTAGGSGNVTIKQEDGSAVAFTNNAGTYTSAAPRFDATLTKSGSTYTYTRRGREFYTFDVATGRLTAETTLAGTKATPTYQTTLAYDGTGHLSTITDPAGRKYTLTWTGAHITKLTDDTGRTITYAYTGSDLTDVYGIGTTRTPSLLSNDRAQYTYVSGKHLLNSMRSPKNYGGPANAVTAMTYDTADRVLTQTDPLGHTTTFTYGPNTTPALTAGQTLITDPAGHKTLDTYANSLLLSETKGYGTPDAGTTAFTYDPISLGITTIVDPDGNLSTFSYDTHGNRTSSSNPLGYTTLSMWDDAGDLIESVDPTGTATVNVYDQAGHITTSTGTNPGGFSYGDLTSTTITQANNVVESTTGNFGTAPTRTVNYYYTDPAHPADLTKTVDANTHTTLATYDTFGDVTSQTNGAGDVTKYGYNTGTGWPTSTVDGNGTAAGTVPGCTPPATGCSTTAYNIWGQVTQTTDPLGHTTKATYDADGNQLTSTDGNNRTTTNTFDAAGRVTKVTNADNTFTVTDNNNDDTIADTIDPLNAKTIYGYDGQGRQVTVKDPDNRTSTTKFDPAGIATTVTDATGRVTTLTHDAAGRTTRISYSDGTTPTVTFAYDPNGHPVTMTDATGTSTWTYDAFGQLTTNKNGASATVGYGYDQVGNLTAITYPGQTTPVARTFDNADRLATVKDFTSNTTTFGYDHDSALTTTTYLGGSVVTNAFNTAEQLTGVTAKKGTTTLATYGYGRDNAGQVNSQTIAGTTQTFTYSAREQLATGVTGSTTTNYAYDAADHPTTVGATTATFDPAGQECWSTTTAVTTPTCGSKPAGATSYTFDGIGNRTATTPATGTVSSYSYDQAGRLTTATTPTGSGTYTYNGLGQRTSKKVGTVTTNFVWDAGTVPNMLSDGSTNYLYGPDGNPIEQTNGTATSFYVHDQIGSTRTLLTTTGTVTGSYDYTPYGTGTHTGTAATPLQFSGQYNDTETGLIYLRARYYDPTTAQFLTIDPLLSQTSTPYAYVTGNPLNRTDPSGLCWVWDWVCDGAESAVDSFKSVASSGWDAAKSVVNSPVIQNMARNFAFGMAGRILAGGGSTSNSGMVGANGTKTPGSITIGSNSPNRTPFRIDVENLEPGEREGNMHLQDRNNTKYYYNFDTNTFDGAPKNWLKECQKDPRYARAVAQGKAILGEN